MTTKLKWTLALMIASIMVGCNGCGEQKGATAMTDDQVQQQLINDAREVHETEMMTIKKYVKAMDLPMTETKSGLHYWIYETGTGELAQLEQFASISYTITLMDGTLCYVATDADPKQFRIGQDNVETGLHEALQLMHVGDKAKFILPSHLAFGFTGDSGKIPQNATVLYDVHLLSVQ